MDAAAKPTWMYLRRPAEITRLTWAKRTNGGQTISTPDKYQKLEIINLGFCQNRGYNLHF